MSRQETSGWLVMVLALCLSALARPAAADEAEADKLDAEIQRLVDEHQYDVAALKADKALKVWKASVGEDDHRTAEAMATLGMLYVLLDDLVRAAPLLKEAHERLAKSRAGQKEHATVVSYLARFHAKRGETAEAERRYEEALQLAEKAYGPEADETAAAKRNLALAIGVADYRRGEQLLVSARQIHEKLGNHRAAIVDIVALANLRKATAQGPAFELYREALDRADEVLGPDDLARAELLKSAAVYHRRVASSAGSPEATAKLRALADAQFKGAERIFLHAYGPTSAQLSDLYAEWALNAQAARDFDRAVELMAKSSDIDEEHLATLLASESESVKLAYLQKLKRRAEDTVSMQLRNYFAMRKRHDKLAALAFTTILRRKGRALDAVAQGVAALRASVDEADRALLERLIDERAKLAAMVIRGPQGQAAGAYKQAVAAQDEKVRELDEQVSAKSAAYRAIAEPITLEAVQAAIPENAALVEIARIQQRDPTAYSGTGAGPTNYVAYVLRRNGPVRFAPLAEAGPIEHVVEQFREALRDPENKRVGDPAYRLQSMIFRGLRPLIDDVEHVIIAPDGALNLVPFAALSDGEQFLIDKWEFSYVSSGRDLLRFGRTGEPTSGPAIVADPAFDGAGSSSAGGGTRGTLAGAYFSPLPGTRQEAEGLAAILEKASSLLGPDATEAALKHIERPSILHIATHGFFLSNKPKKRSWRDRARARDDRALELELEPPPPLPNAPPPPRIKWQIGEPLLRAGLALSGANVRRGGTQDDGILTALEASGLDLHGTQLVALSACETGLGEVRGDGVFGMRRALVIAGAETQIMSLWKVDDEATRDLMLGYYKRLLEGKGRSASMREVQREMMAEARTRHPYFWAAFIVSGNPAPLHQAPERGTADQAGAGNAVPEVPPGAGSCGCSLPGAPRSDVGALGLAWLLLALAQRRRPRSTTSGWSPPRR